MTKVGEGKEFPKEARVQQYHKQLDAGSSKFLTALEAYEVSKDPNDRLKLKAVMDAQLDVIRSAVNELKRAGVHKQEVKVENDYQNYIQGSTIDSYAALEHDMQTLREYNQLP